MQLDMPKVVSAHGAADSADPNVSEPTEFVAATKALGPIHGLRGYLDFTTGGNTADLEFWVKNEHPNSGASTKWVLMGTLSAVPNLTMFEHPGLTGAKVFIRLRNISGGNPIDVFAEQIQG